MYEEHFGLREPPFNNTPDPRFFQATPNHEEALACLIYAVEQRKGFVLLTGEVGAGKTLVTRMMLRHLGEQVRSAVITNTALTADELMKAICLEFGLECSAGASQFDRFSVLQDFLLEQFAAGRSTVLVLDEAQNLTDEGLEQIRMIGNLEADDAKLLQVVIVGQPELRDHLAVPAMRPLAQRIFRSFHLPVLAQAKCADYIDHRLNVARIAAPSQEAGGSEDLPNEIFDDQAIAAIAKFSGGVPRLINTACDNALINAYADDRRTIDGPFIEEVLAQLEALPNDGHLFSDCPVDAKPSDTVQPAGDALMAAAPVTRTERIVEPDVDRTPVVASPVAGQQPETRTTESLLTPISDPVEVGRQASRLARARRSYQQLIHHLADVQRGGPRTSQVGDAPVWHDPSLDEGARPAARLQHLLDQSRSSLDTLRSLVRQDASPSQA